MKRLLLLLCLLAALPSNGRAEDKPRVEFRDGDRIALVGNEFFERDQERGYIETELTTRFPDKNLTFRNLGYSGDTVRADARNLCSGWAVFGPADQGFDRLKSLVEHIKPTLVFVAYGMNESFDGPAGLDSFVQGLGRMLDMLSSGGTRIVLVSPIRHEELGRPLPDPTEHNKNLQLYIDAMGKVAQQRGYPLINLFETMGEGRKDRFAHPFTFDGIHLTPYGYWRAASIIEQACGYPERSWTIQLDAKGGPPRSSGTKVDGFKSDGGSLSFNATDAELPLASPPADAPLMAVNCPSLCPGGQRYLGISNLPRGQYALRCDDKVIASAPAEEWAKNVWVPAGQQQAQEEQLRKLVIAKEFDFFNFWRPDNDTYIFGYRKHEQGRNAVEIPRFEPLVEAKEAEIAKLRMPVSHSYVLAPEPAK